MPDATKKIFMQSYFERYVGMKKILIVFIFITLPVFVHAQLSGSGTYADPWSGTLAGDATWSGTKYINGDITVDNEKLTISAGAIIIFLAEGADLIITGTGSLDASGTSGSKITITSDDDNDGVYGESGERWGHIYFNLPNESNQSKIDYCIIEFGDVHTFTDYQGYGGAVHSNFSNLIISNSTLRNNYSKWGGAVFVNASKNPTIKNCYIYNNKSDRGGGGVYCWNSSSSVIENCIFDSNQCLETSISYYTGGGLAAQTGCSIKVVNCTFVNNTSTRTEGQSLFLHSSLNSRVINSIFWGSSAKQIYCYGTTPASIIVNCAYRGITYTTGTPVSPVILNSVNDASDGPNFNATDGSDWSIKYVSPCRDAGVNSYTGVTIPSTDYIGNPTVYTKDIGAYEVQYSRWKTTASSTDWTTAANWDGGVPTSSRDVVVPTGATNYPTGSPTQDFTLGAGKLMIMEPGSRLTLDDLTNDGTLKMNASSSGFASLIINSYTRGTGATEEIQLYLTGGGNEGDDNFKWHYISTPVSSLSTNVFTAVTPDLAQFIESRPTLSLLQGWVAYDGYQYSSGEMGGPTFNTLNPGQGYDFFDYSDHLFTFSGDFNTSDAAMNLDYSGIPYLHGFNLLGNPYSSGLDWNDIANSVYFAYPVNTSKGVYFTRDNVQCTYIGGVGIPGDVTGIIPPMQGFFNKTYSSGNMITIPAAARTHANIHSTYKGESSIPLIRLAIFENSISGDETVVRFDDEAKSDLDNDFDALKMFLSANRTAIYSSMSGTNYVINGQPFPDTLLEVPLVVNVTSSGNHKISTIQIQNLLNYKVVLKDNVTGLTTNLRSRPEVTFSAPAGLISNRFILKIIDIFTGIEDPVVPDGAFNIYYGYDFINIRTLADEWDGKSGSLRVLDLTGKSVADIQNAEFSKNSVIQIPAPYSKGLYIVEIRSGINRYVGKVIIR
jgi:hypothetical protein